MKARYYRYLCFTDQHVHAIKSKQPLDNTDAAQAQWLERQCGGRVLLAVML